MVRKLGAAPAIAVTLIVRTLFVLVAMSVWPLAAAGGVLIVEKTVTGDAPAPTHQIQIDKDWMRMEHTLSGEKVAFVFDGAKQVMWIVNYDRKAYNEMTKADVDRLGVQMSAAMAQMQEQISRLPPDQRAMVEAATKGRGVTAGAPAKTVFRKAGTDTVGPWMCDKYEGYQNNQKIAELCTVDPKALGFTAADFEVSRQLAEFFQKMMPQNAENMFRLGAPDQQGFSGIPVRRVSLGQKQSVTELTDATRQTFPDSVFELPAGFQKQALFGGRGGQ